jgi:hypothetical protein
MESKKINQLATELSPDLSDLTIIGDPTTGISKKITLSQMASLFTGTVEEYANFAAFPLVGVADTIYVAKDTNVIYRWDSTAYVVLSPNVIASLVFNDANGFDGNIALVGSVATLTITTALTTGSVGFIGASGALLQDNANFFWDDTNNRLGLGTNAPTTALDVFGSGIIGRINGTSTNNAYLGFASAGTNKWSVGNVQSDHRFRIFSEANSAELISVLQTGEFGIGIANPTTKFHIDGAASALIANLDADVSVAKSVSFRSDNSNRFNIEVSGLENGGNAGANFFIKRYSDAGALIDTPLTIMRQTGAITLANTLNLSEIQASTSAGITLKSNGGTSVALFGAGGGAGTTLYGGLIATSAGFSGTLENTGGSGIQTSVAGGFRLRNDANNANLGGLTRRSYWVGGSALDLQIFAETGYGIFLNVNGSQAGMAISSGGNVSIGTMSPTGRLMLYQSAAGNLFQNIVSPNGGFTQVGINLSPSMTDTEIASNPAQASIYATDTGYGANIIFANKNIGAVGNSLTERMRISDVATGGWTKITNSGSYLNAGGAYHEIFSSSNGNILVLTMASSVGPIYGLDFGLANIAPNNGTNFFATFYDSAATRFQFLSNGGLKNYQANNVNLSDERTKKEIAPLESYWNKFKAIEIVKFKYIDQTHDDFNIGVIAQQVESIAPEFIDIDGWGNKLKLDEEDNEIVSTEEPLKSVYTSDLHHATIKVLQEAMAKIEILEEEVKLLKAK